MKARGLLAVLACVVAALPADAVAQGREVHPGSFSLEIGLPAREGWRMKLTAEDHRHIDLTAARGAMQIVYHVTGRASSKLLRADFGPFGRVEIAMDLGHATPVLRPMRQRRGKRRCRGRAPVELEGRYSGTVEFAGDAGIAPISAPEGFAEVRRIFRTVCQPPKESGAPIGRSGFRFELRMLAARSHFGGRTTSFDAIAVGIEGEPIAGLISGGVHERLGRVRVVRTAVEFVEASELQFESTEQRGKRVEVRPPSPFTGRASYLRAPGHPPTWVGDMAVRVPVAGNVSLAGSEFDTTFCEISHLTDFSQLQRCLQGVRELGSTTTSGPLSTLLYGSGSHSQPLALARLSSLR
jgi:hypothetical protein